MEHILVERNEVRGLERGLQAASSPIGGVWIWVEGQSNLLMMDDRQ
jgi:hypothetical protein